MKELSIEEKAKRYDEAIERARLINNKGTWVRCGSTGPSICEQIFPELKESEDEKIRKEIISALKYANHKGVYDKHLAWLEKQGKEEYVLKSFKDEDVRKFMQYIEKEAKAYEFNLPNRGYDIYAFAKDLLVWLEKQGEQKELKKIEQKPTNNHFTPEQASILDKHIDKFLEQKHAEWSEEDENIIKELINDFEEILGTANGIDKKTHGYSVEKLKELIDWLKSLKDRVQPTQVWSVEDKLMLMSCIEIMQTVDSTEEQQNWLKELIKE